MNTQDMKNQAEHVLEMLRRATNGANNHDTGNAYSKIVSALYLLDMKPEDKERLKTALVGHTHSAFKLLERIARRL